MHHCQVISLKAFFESIFPVAPLRKLSHAHAVAEERNWEGPGNQQTEKTAKIQFHFWIRIGSVDVKKHLAKNMEIQPLLRYSGYLPILGFVSPASLEPCKPESDMTCIPRWVASRCGTKAMPMSSSSHRCFRGCARRRMSQKP